MPKPADDNIDSTLKQLYVGFAVVAFSIPLCIETTHASEEKFLGINVSDRNSQKEIGLKKKSQWKC